LEFDKLKLVEHQTASLRGLKSVLTLIFTIPYSDAVITNSMNNHATGVSYFVFTYRFFYGSGSANASRMQE